METSVKERLIEFLNYKKISISEFGRRLGVSSAFITSMRKSIQPDKLQSIALNFPDINIQWLIKYKMGSNFRNEGFSKNSKPLLISGLHC